MSQGKRALAGLCGMFFGASLLIVGCADEEVAAPAVEEQQTVRLTLEASAAAGEDLSDAAYRHRNFAGALKMLREGGPDILVPKRHHGFTDLTEEQLARAGPGCEPRARASWHRRFAKLGQRHRRAACPDRG